MGVEGAGSQLKDSKSNTKEIEQNKCTKEENMCNGDFDITGPGDIKEKGYDTQEQKGLENRTRADRMK
ncbi:hypothetical protein NDU88_003597 [Pleurodeles waltl]|uniref:Uncharacterized protein n=1 Tax=Pleurodeles waltl TaxID=8319 RepID=A0AAV7NGU6_PLEWA|nr:hypothetical protein NDU88_003597 [Pleurodeles waltl]